MTVSGPPAPPQAARGRAADGGGALARLAARLPRTAAERGWWAYAGHLWNIWALAISNLCLALAALFALRGAVALGAGWRRYREALLPLGVYGVLVLASIAGSYDPRHSLEGARELLGLLTLPLAFLLVRREDRVHRLANGVVVLGALLAASGLTQLLFGFGDLHHRIRGPLSHYMTFAGVLSVALLIVLAQLAHRPAAGRLWRWPVLVLIATALVVSLTRSAWVALLPAVLVLLALRGRRALLAVVPAAVVLLLAAPLPVVERVLSIADVRELSNYDRLCMAEAGLLMVSEKPLFGLGPGMVRERYPIYGHPTSPRHRPPHLHNSFLQIAGEKGLPALAAYLWLMGAAGLAAARRFRAEGGWHGDRAGLYVATLLVLVAFNLAGLFEDNWADTEVQRLVLFVIAIPWCLPAAPASRDAALAATQEAA